MKKRFFLLCVGALLMAGCSEQEPPESDASPGGDASIDTLVEGIRQSHAAHDPAGLAALIYREGEPPEITETIGGMLEKFWKDEKLEIGVLGVKNFEEYTPPMDLPGKLKGKQMEYLVPPSHWVIVPLSTPPGTNPMVQFSLSFAAGQVDGEWKLMGTRFSEE